MKLEKCITKKGDIIKKINVFISGVMWLAVSYGANV